MMLVVTVAAMLALGREVSLRLWRGARLTPFEHAASTLATGTVLWLASVWALALPHLLTRPALITRTLAVAILAAFLWVRRRREALPQINVSARILGALLPLFLWSVFILWRGAVVPPLSHDALAYHLPKAVLYARAGGFEVFSQLEPRIRSIPVNYELLLADAILLDGTDTWTEWINFVFWTGFIVAGVALAQRWFRPHAVADAALVLLLAAVPVVILHAGAHKNDLMTAFFMTAALHWGARWCRSGERAALFLQLATIVAAIGTKPQAGVLAAALLPLTLVRLWADRRAFGARGIALVAALTIAAVVLLGGAPFARRGTAEVTGGAASMAGYGDWSNLWQAPYVLLAAPLSPHPGALYVPWSATRWFWKRYEIFFSELGIHFTLAALALPFAIAFLRHADRDSRRERVTTSVVALITFVLLLPVRFQPHGMYTVSLPRYVLFIVPVVFAWTFASLLRRMQRGAMIVLGGAAILFTWYAADCAVHDVFAPLDYVVWARANPETRVIPFDQHRPASLVDRYAQPSEPVAIESSAGTWIHPAFGADLGRPVEIFRRGTTPNLETARWIILDRTFEAVWKAPNFRDLSQSRKSLGPNAPPLKGDPVFARLRQDRRFELVYYWPSAGQAVFARRR